MTSYSPRRFLYQSQAFWRRFFSDAYVRVIESGHITLFDGFMMPAFPKKGNGKNDESGKRNEKREKSNKQRIR